jgi:radical SAM protein with 4Fe4S-binding SPASM domain
MGAMKDTTSDATNIMKRLDEASAIGVRIVDFTGGEPTQHPRIIELLDYAGAKHFEKLNLSTNGMALGKSELLTAVKRNNVTCNISMDGATQQTVDKIRGSNVFRRLETVFGQLKSNNIPFSLRFSINKLNVHEVEDIIDYAASWKVKIDLEPTQKIGNAIENSLVIDEDEKRFVSKIIQRKKSEADIEIEESFTQKIPCDGGFHNLLTINAEDQAVSCLMISRSYKMKSPEERVSLVDYWAGVQKTKTKMRVFKPEFPQCPECEFLHICETGCHVTAHAKGCI